MFKKKSILLFVVMCVSLVLGGCNTMGGVGEDLKAAGGAIKDTAQKAKDKISK